MKNLLSLREPSPRHDGVGAASIDDRIRAIEQRLVAREHALALRFGALGERLRRAARPRRMLRPMLGIAGALFALWWLLHGRLPAQQAQRGARSGGDASWAHWLALVWPLLPPAWRSRVSPASAAALVSLGIPLAERLLGRRSYPPLDTAAQVDLTRYAGTWYEIARLPTPHESPCDAQARAHYTSHGDGLLVRNACPHRGVLRTVRGVARVIPGSGNAKLKMSLWPAWLRWLPAAWRDHWLLYVDEGYRVAVVGHPDRRHLWLLARAPRIDAAQLDELIRLAGARGFAVDRLLLSQPA